MYASATRLASTIQPRTPLLQKRRPSIKTTLPFHNPLSRQFSQKDFKFLEKVARTCHWSDLEGDWRGNLLDQTDSDDEW